MFTDTDLPVLNAEADHRRHAAVEQVIADLQNGPLAHLPSGRSARRTRLRLPRSWPWDAAWPHLLNAAIGPPAAA